MLRMFESVSFFPQSDEFGLKDYSVGCLQNVWGVTLKQAIALPPTAFPVSHLALSDIFRRECVIAEYHGIIYVYVKVYVWIGNPASYSVSLRLHF
jgi:hypothetical protein